MPKSIIKMNLLSVLTFWCYCQLSSMEPEPGTLWEYEPEISWEEEFINEHRALFSDKNAFVSDDFNGEMITAFAYDNEALDGLKAVVSARNSAIAINPPSSFAFEVQDDVLLRPDRSLWRASAKALAAADDSCRVIPALKCAVLATANKKRVREDQADDEITKRKSKKQNRFGYCSECHKNLKDLSQHKRIMHGHASQLIACNYPDCKKQVSAYKMKRHLNNCHGDGSKLMACIHCDKQMAVYLMKKHIAIHGDGSKLVACIDCNKQIAASYMKQHMHIIHGDGSQSIACTYPGCKRQLKKHKLNQHLKRHLMNTQDYFTCKYQACNKEFPSSASIVKHLKKEHALSSPWKPHYYKETRVLNL